MMNEFAIDHRGFQIYYDMKSNNENSDIYYPVEPTYGSKFYVRPHRDDGPAFIGKNSSWAMFAYYVHGKYHNTEGPALIWTEKLVEWRIYNISHTFKEWCEKLNKSEEEINFLKLKYNYLTDY